MAMEAAVHGDAMLLKQAMLHDPLCAAVANPEEIWQMTDELLVAQAQWLPQYHQAIDQAAKTLALHEERGTRIRLRDTRGAARLHTKTVEEMSRDKAAARINAQAADKGNMTRSG
jgi:alpha-galactosidase